MSNRLAPHLVIDSEAVMIIQESCKVYMELAMVEIAKVLHDPGYTVKE